MSHSPTSAAATTEAEQRGSSGSATTGRSARLPEWLRIDRYEAAILFAFFCMTWVVLLGLATRPLEMTGVDSGVPADQLQYLSWIRSAGSHIVIQNLWDVGAPGTSYFVHPGYLLSGLLHRAGLGLWQSYQFLWKPVAIVVLFFGFLAYVRRMLPAGTERRAGLALALFYVSPFAALVGVTFNPDARIRGQLDFMSGEMFPGLYMWGYMMTAIAVGLIPVVLLCLERARVPERRRGGRGAAFYVCFAALAAFFMTYLQPWQGVAVLGTIVLVELLLWRRGERASPRVALTTVAPVLLAGALPLAYYFVMSHADPAWELAGHANRNAVGNWPWYAWVLGLLPIAVPAYLGFRLPARDWQALAVRVLPLAMVGEYWYIFYTGAGTFPFHSVQGMSLPLSVLAVQGVAARRWSARWRSPAVVWGAVLLLTLPGVVHKLNNTRREVHRGGSPYFLEPGEKAGLKYIEHSPVPGGVMAPIYSGLVVPAYTGRHTWVGQVSWTRDYNWRKRIGARLFGRRLSRAASLALIRDSKVRFLFGDCFQAKDMQPVLRGYLDSVHRFGCASVYQLDPTAIARVPGRAPQPPD